MPKQTPSETQMSRLLDVMRRLRDPEGGCPWDLEQTFATIVPYTIEEAHEVADAIGTEDWEGLADELGDLLFQVVFYTQMADEKGLFDFHEVARRASDKMIRRHPHVFADAHIHTSAAQTLNWEEQKAAERAARAKFEGRAASALDGVARGLPALTRAAKLQTRAARVGFDWGEPGPVLDKIEEEIGEVRAEVVSGAGIERVADEIGDLFFACVNLARHLGADAETATRHASAKFERRFRRVETLLAAKGRRAQDSTLDEMDRLWSEAKSEETK
jgi:ATP diphosphatase